MSAGATKTETHETVWEGTFTGDEFKELFLDMLRAGDVPCLGFVGVSLELTIGTTLMATKFPDVHYKATRDELWMRKRMAGDA